MEWDSYVKRLDFEDVSLTVAGPLDNEPTASEEGDNDVLSVSGAPSRGSFAALPDDCSVAELRQAAQHIRKDLSTLDDYVSGFSPQQFQKTVKADALSKKHSSKQWQESFSILEADTFELKVKEEILKLIADWKIGDEMNEDDSWLANENDPDNMGDELTALKNANAETILEIESLIKTVASDVSGLETDVTNAFGDLDSFESEVDKAAESELAGAHHDKDTNAHLSVLCRQSENLHDLESTIRQLEETLRKNEKEYAEAEAAMESRIEQYNLEIEELQAQASQLDREEECMRTLIDVASSFFQTKRHMNSSNDVSMEAMENGNIELRLTTYLPSEDEPQEVPDQGSEPTWEHRLHIKMNQETMEMEEAKISPESVPIDDLFAVARGKRGTSASLESVKEGELVKFGPQLAFLVRAVQQRLTIHAFKVALLSSYSVEHTPGSSVVSIIKAGKLKALVEMPEGWPMWGCSLRFQALQLLNTPVSDASATEDTMKMAVEVANKMPAYIRHDLLTFMQAAERITSE